MYNLLLSFLCVTMDLWWCFFSSRIQVEHGKKHGFHSRGYEVSGNEYVPGLSYSHGASSSGMTGRARREYEHTHAYIATGREELDLKNRNAAHKDTDAWGRDDEVVNDNTCRKLCLVVCMITALVGLAALIVGLVIGFSASNRGKMIILKIGTHNL